MARSEENELDPYMTLAFVLRTPVSGVEELKNVVSSYKGELICQRSSPKRLLIVGEGNDENAKEKRKEK